jgi:hypothetical protein
MMQGPIKIGALGAQAPAQMIDASKALAQQMGQVRAFQ